MKYKIITAVSFNETEAKEQVIRKAETAQKKLPAYVASHLNVEQVDLLVSRISLTLYVAAVVLTKDTPSS